MSSKAVHWAWEQKVKPATTKLVLMAMAEFANPETALAYPSIKALEEMTGLNRKTVLSAVAQLATPREASGLGVLADTGQRAGRTNQIVVYRMSFDPISQSVPKTGPLETVPFSDEKSPVFTTEESRKRDTEPSIEPSRESEPPTPYGVDTPTGDSDLFGGAIPTGPELPIEEYVEEAWHRLKDDFPRIADIDLMTPSRKKLIETRAGEVVRDRKRRGETITAEAAWDAIFAAIRRSTFLCGNAPPGKNRTGPFKLTIEYVTRAREFAKILEGAYDDDERYRGRGGFDAGTGRSYGPAEAAVRSSLDGLFAPGDRRAGGGDPGSAYGGSPRRAAGGTRRLS
jgi:hypothetical protein